MICVLLKFSIEIASLSVVLSRRLSHECTAFVMRFFRSWVHRRGRDCRRPNSKKSKPKMGTTRRISHLKVIAQSHVCISFPKKDSFSSCVLLLNLEKQRSRDEHSISWNKKLFPVVGRSVTGEKQQVDVVEFQFQSEFPWHHKSHTEATKDSVYSSRLVLTRTHTHTHLCSMLEKSLHLTCPFRMNKQTFLFRWKFAYRLAGWRADTGTGVRERKRANDRCVQFEQWNSQREMSLCLFSRRVMAS